jgi:hypothetical protein
VPYDFGSLLGGLALLVGAVFTGLVSLRNARNTATAADLERLEQYERWRPRVLRVVGDLRAILGEKGIPEPPGIDDTIRFPPRDDKVTRDGD